MEKTVSIIWLGHACFKIVWQDYTVVLDPYEDGYIPGLSPVRTTANRVFYSHNHRDHHGEGQVSLIESDRSSCEVTVINSYHDEEKGALRGENKIHVFDDGTFRIAHLGDLGCQLTEEQIEQLKGLDVLLIPVGGYYTIDAAGAKALVDVIKPLVVIPMHYRSGDFGFDLIGKLDEYTKLCDDVKIYSKNRFVLDENTQKQTAILTYMAESDMEQSKDDTCR